MNTGLQNCILTCDITTRFTVHYDGIQTKNENIFSFVSYVFKSCSMGLAR